MNNKRDIYTASNISNPDDIKTRIINIDSRFRQKNDNGNDISGSSSTNFIYDFSYTLYPRNVIFMRIASVEIPNMWYNFSANQHNTIFDISMVDCSGIKHNNTINIPDGIYTTEDLVNVIGIELKAIDPLFTISFNMTTLRISFCYCSPFEINFDTFYIDANGISISERNFEKTLGYKLGFRLPDINGTRTFYDTGYSATMPYTLTSTASIDVIGNSYILLGIEGYHAVEQRLIDYNNFKRSAGIRYTAKIIVREEKGSVIYDDGSSLISSNIIPKSPINIFELKIKLMDGYGSILNLNGLDFSFTIEIIELVNLSIFNTVNT